MHYEHMHTDPNLENPTLSPQEQRLSKGIAAHYYDDGDYRLKRFDANTFTTDPDEWYDVDARMVSVTWLPAYLEMLSNLRQEPGEPMMVGCEVYWNEELIYRMVLEPYTPVPRNERGLLSAGEIEAAEMQRNG